MKPRCPHCHQLLPVDEPEQQKGCDCLACQMNYNDRQIQHKRVRAAAICRLRDSGMTWREVALTVGVSKSRVAELVKWIRLVRERKDEMDAEKWKWEVQDALFSLESHRDVDLVWIRWETEMPVPLPRWKQYEPPTPPSGDIIFDEGTGRPTGRIRRRGAK